MSADPIIRFSEAESRQEVAVPLRSTVEFLSRQPSDPRFPFAGGLAGVFGFELCHALEQIAPHRFVDFKFPVLSFGLYDWTIVWDHQLKTVNLVCQGWPELEPRRRRRNAEARIQQVERQLSHAAPTPTLVFAAGSLTEIAPQFPTRVRGVTSNFSGESYRGAIADVIEYIRAGDVFQVNLAQRLVKRQTLRAAEHYLSLRQTNRAPFAGYYDDGDWQVLSSSPERLMRIVQRQIESRPIKGTCPRTGDNARDRQLGETLLRSEKDRAENTMIVDLMRNDLSRVCMDDSLEVAQLCGLEVYARVRHLVSVVRGLLRPEINVLDAIRCVFPGGSVTGAPKPRALELIAELEPTSRGAYCGSLGYISCRGNSDLNLLIRTMTTQGGWLQIPVGGGITARSDPAQEEQETWDKAAGMLAAIT